MQSHRVVGDQAEQILYWQQKLEEVKQGYEKIFPGENYVYIQQDQKLLEVHNKKLETLEKWREDKLASIQSEKEKRIALLKSECERHRAGVPKLLEQTIQRQFDQLKGEFSGVFDYFMVDDIPFMHTFAFSKMAKIFAIDCSKPLLDPNQIRHDFDEVSKVKIPLIVRNGEIVTEEKIWRIGDQCFLRFGRMKPVLATISSVQPDILEFLPQKGSQVIRVGVQALEMRIVSLCHE
jgi:uncharacterized small protein (DUF1192 family)